MTKRLLSSFIIYAIFAGIIVMLRTTINYFGGIGFGFVAIIGLLASSIILTNIDKHVANRTKDLLICSSVFTIFEFFIYFVIEYRVGTIKAWNVFLGIQNVLSFIAIFMFAYVILRLITELKDVKLGFVEAILNNTKTKRIKKSREFENGSLEEKPNKKGYTESEINNIETEINNIEPEIDNDKPETNNIELEENTETISSEIQIPENEEE